MSCDDDVLSLHLELHVRDGTIDGELTEQGGAPVTFAGWIGLTSVLDRAVRRAERLADAPADEGASATTRSAARTSATAR